MLEFQSGYCDSSVNPGILVLFLASQCGSCFSSVGSGIRANPRFPVWSLGFQYEFWDSSVDCGISI